MVSISNLSKLHERFVSALSTQISGDMQTDRQKWPYYKEGRLWQRATSWDYVERYGDPYVTAHHQIIGDYDSTEACLGCHQKGELKGN
jgi:hypothetical protein